MADFAVALIKDRQFSAVFIPAQPLLPASGQWIHNGVQVVGARRSSRRSRPESSFTFGVQPAWTCGAFPNVATRCARWHIPRSRLIGQIAGDCGMPFIEAQVW